MQKWFEMNCKHPQPPYKPNNKSGDICLPSSQFVVWLSLISIQEVIKSLQQTVIAFQTKLLEYSSQFNITLLSNVKSKIEILIPQTGFTHYNKVGPDDQRL